jgi:hypothetical protein
VRTASVFREGAVSAPDGLADPGRTLWGAVVGPYELRSDELPLLEAACRTADELRTLETALRGAEPVTAGSTGQERVHPLYAEVRAHRQTLKAMLAALGLTEALADAGGDHGAERSHAGRQLARQRWGVRGVA